VRAGSGNKDYWEGCRVAGRPGEPVIAIDGPSGAGKSTVAQRVAKQLGYRYLDTGAMYRAITWLALHEHADLDDPTALGALAQDTELQMTTQPGPARVQVTGIDVTAAIRGADVTAAVSRVSAVPAVRAALVRRQRALIGDGGVVVEGRDIGSTVVPDAFVKVFLTAEEGARASRRAQETADAAASTRVAMARRDALDAGRAASPLRRAEDAVVIDSTDLSADDVVDRVVQLVRARQSAEPAT
jgi:cytidylate kinase